MSQQNGRPAAAYTIFRRASKIIDAQISRTTASAQTVTTKEITGGGFTFPTTGMLAFSRGNRDVEAEVNLVPTMEVCVFSSA